MTAPVTGASPPARVWGQGDGGPAREPAGARRASSGGRDDLDQAQITLNGFRVYVRPDQFAAFVRDLPDASELLQLRNRRRPVGAVVEQGDAVRGASCPRGIRADADEKTLDVQEHLGLSRS